MLWIIKWCNMEHIAGAPAWTRIACVYFAAHGDERAENGMQYIYLDLRAKFGSRSTEVILALFRSSAVLFFSVSQRISQ